MNTVVYNKLIKTAENILANPENKKPLSDKIFSGLAAGTVNSAVNKIPLELSKALDIPNDRTVPEMRKLIKETTKDMGVKDKTFWKRHNSDSHAGWIGNNNIISTPLSASEASLAHEVGHLKNWQAFGKAKLPLAVATRLPLVGSNLISSVYSGFSDEASYNPAHVNLAIHTPTLLDEGLASIRATSHLINKKGLKAGLKASASLLPSFGTYAAMAASPYLITAARKFGEGLRTKNTPDIEKVAFLPALKAVQPYAGKAFQGAKNLMSSSWKGMSGFDKTLTVGLPAVTTLPTMFDKQDDQGRSRAERLATTGGNIAGGLLGGGLGMKASNAITKALPGKVGKGLGFLANTAGMIGGSIAGEKATSAPFNAFKPKPQTNTTQNYALNVPNPPPQSPAPQANIIS
jgi:hypothetical protein